MNNKKIKHQYDGMSDIVALIKSEGTDNKFYVETSVQVWNSTNDSDYEEYVTEYLEVNAEGLLAGYIPELGRSLVLDGLYPEGNLSNDESTYEEMVEAVEVMMDE